MINIPDDPQALDDLADAVMSRGGSVIVTDMLNDWRVGITSGWDIVREILRLASEESAGGVQTRCGRGKTPSQEEDSMNSFEVRDGDLLCTQFNGMPVEWKLAERFMGRFEFEEVEFLNEIHETDLITAELLNAARAIVG
jgi:hypothetical protein